MNGQKIIPKDHSILSLLTANKIVAVDIKRIIPSKDQPRRFFDSVKIAGLAANIEKDGIRQPVILRAIDPTLPETTNYELIAGERRFHSAQAAGITSIPSIIKPFDDAEAAKFALLDNCYRENLSPLEETKGILHYLQVRLNCKNLKETRKLTRHCADTNPQEGTATAEERTVVEDIIRDVTGMSVNSFVHNRFPLLDMPADVLHAFESGKLPYSVAVAISRIDDSAFREELVTMVLEHGASRSEINSRIKKWQQATSKANPCAEYLSQSASSMKKLSLKEPWKQDPETWTEIEAILERLKYLAAKFK